MAIQYVAAGGEAGLFNLLGKLQKAVALLDNTRADVFDDLADELHEEYETTPGLQEVLAAITPVAYAWKTGLPGNKRFLVGHVGNLLAHFITVLEGYHSRDIDFLFDLLEDRMTLDSESVLENGMTLGTPSYGRESGTKNTDPDHGDNSCVGNFTLLRTSSSGKGHWDDYTNEYIFTQALRVVCTSGVNEGADDGDQSFEVVGQEPPAAGVYAGEDTDDVKLWQRQGTVGSLTMLGDNSGNILDNGGFEDWTADEPDDWDVDAGTGGTDFEENTDDEYRGDSCLEIDCDTDNGAKVVTLSQTIADSVEAERTYVLCVRMKKGAGMNDADSVIIKPQGTGYTPDAAETISKTGATLTTSYVLYHCFFNTPEQIPADFEIEIETSTVGTGLELFIDELCLMEVSKLRGLGLVVVAGDDEAYADDMVTMTVTNDYAGKFQTFVGRFFNRSLVSDSSGNNTINENLCD